MTMKNKKSIKVKKKRNGQMIFLNYFFFFIFAALIYHIANYVAVDSAEDINNSYNSRQALLAEKYTRGEILSCDGDVLAKTITDANGNETRNYPYKELFSHVVGYSQKGKTGIELQANMTLLSSSTKLTDQIQNQIEDEKTPGDNVYTTLDVDLQQAAYDALGIYKGAIVAIDPSSGKILAMVSKPDYDPNNIVTDWDTLTTDDGSSELVNRATQGLYPPGSTFKIITALEYIREHPDDYNDYSFSCNGSFSYGEDVINCYHNSNHGKVDLKTSFAKSCNSSFANIGISLDRSSFQDTAEQLLFDKELPLKMEYCQSYVDITKTTSDSDILQAAIGQGKTQVTPIHMAMITSAIANKGKLMKPYVIDHIESANGTVVKQYAKSTYGTLMTENEASILTEFMTEVVENGTATKLSGLSYTAAGKTGSAEYSGQSSESHAWFTGFAPAENPQIEVTVIMESAGSGGDYAVPIARRVFDAYFKKISGTIK